MPKLPRLTCQTSLCNAVFAGKRIRRLPVADQLAPA
jgi:hypothetical protein